MLTFSLDITTLDASFSKLSNNAVWREQTPDDYQISSTPSATVRPLFGRAP